MTALHYYTNNTQQAQALCMCGAELVDIWNVYSPEILQRLGFATAREAWKSGKPGRVGYYFRNTPELARLIQVWDETQAQVEKGEEVMVAPDPEDVMRIACATLKHRNGFANRWKAVTPKVEIPKAGEVRREKVGDEMRVVMPGFRLVSINATAETKAKLGF